MRWASLLFGILSLEYAFMAQDALLPVWHRHDVFVKAFSSMLIPACLAFVLGIAAVLKRSSWLNAIPACIGVSLAIVTAIQLVYWVRAWG